ncbi:thioredoxin-like protein [Gorgonomyces haynaldii]|nr:thioredoxin-like protein [Gorgonomyces haynaldii]
MLLASLVSLVLGFEDIKAAYLKAEKSIHHLDQSSFNTQLKLYDYVVFYGAEWCPHCQKSLTPTWLELQKWAENDALLKSKGIKVGKVECTLNEELCQNLLGFPTLRYYQNSKQVEESDERDLDVLKQWISKLAENKKTEISHDPYRVLQEMSSTETDQDLSVNPDGVMVHLTDADFDEKTMNSPWLFMFHAPWCGHCKQFGPIYESIAPTLRHRVNVGKIDCTVEKKTCAKFPIRGYPTIGFRNHPQPFAEFTGKRSQDNVRDFALKQVTTPTVKPIKPKELESLIKSKDVGFFFVYDATKQAFDFPQLLNSVKKTKNTIGSLYVCPELECMSILEQTGQNALVVVKDGGLVKSRYRGVLIGQVGEQLMETWFLDNRFPLVPQLDESTQTPLFDHETIVLGIFDPETDQQQMDQFRLVAKEHNQKSSSSVQFAWIDQVQFGDYIKRVYGLRESPGMVIAKPKQEIFYGKHKDRQLLQPTKESVSRIMDEIAGGQVQPQSTRGFIGNMMLGFQIWFSYIWNLIVQYWFVFVILIGGSVAGLYWMMRPRHYLPLEQKQK